jgi:hypothetical protein
LQDSRARQENVQDVFSPLHDMHVVKLNVSLLTSTQLGVKRADICKKKETIKVTKYNEKRIRFIFMGINPSFFEVFGLEFKNFTFVKKLD